jgi:hypothetical protein
MDVPLHHRSNQSLILHRPGFARSAALASYAAAAFAPASRTSFLALLFEKEGWPAEP